jgi:hypothetical protein
VCLWIGIVLLLLCLKCFATAIILCSKQVKMCLVCYIDYDLCQLLNFVTQLSHSFAEYRFQTCVYCVIFIEMVILTCFLNVE